MKKKAGTVYLVGAGPGDPGLLTVKGAGLLAAAEVLVYDRLASEELLQLAPKDCERIYVGKEPGRHAWPQEAINQLLVKKAGEGKLVVRLKGGDPFVFGRGGEEALELLRHGIACETVSGVTSAVAVPAHAGIPVTHRGLSQSFHVITGHTALDESGESLPDAFELYAKLPGTLVFLMGLSNLERITKRLLAGGRKENTPAAVISEGTLPGERLVRAPLKEICARVRSAGLLPPGILIVGETAALCLTSPVRRPLSGAVVGITGTDRLYERLSARLTALGAGVVRAARSKIVRENEERLAAELKDISAYDWVVFTSQNAVQLFFETMQRERLDLRTMGSLSFAVVGSATKEYLSSFGIYADYVPESYTTKALARGLSRAARPGSRILLPRARQGSESLEKILSAAGFACMDLPIYDVVTENAGMDRLAGLTYLIFASGSGVRGFFAGEAGEKRCLPAGVRPVCIGAVTEKVLADYGVTGALVAADYTAAGIAEAIMEDYGAVCL